MNNRCFGPRRLGASITALSLLLAGPASAQFAITPTSNGGTLASALDASSSAVTITSASYIGANGAAGVYTQGPSGIEDGVIITSGSAVGALPPSNSGSTSTSNNQPGDSLCDPLTAPFPSRDRARLDMTFDLEAGFDGISFQLLFGSEEFPEYVGSSYNDTVGVYLNGQQVAFDANGNAISINGPFFSGSSVEVPPANGLEYDGSTGLLITQAQATGGSTGNTLTVVVCDAGDTALDSGALLANLNGCVGNDCSGTIPCSQVDDDLDGVTACTDCDDTDASVYPGAAELCDGADNDCDGFFGADELDNDGDGFAACDGDCDDTDSSVSPNALEECDGIDNDCNGAADFPGEDTDSDGDSVSDCADVCLGDDASGDTDNDGVCNDIDNCPFVDNSDQSDVDGD
ncbi:MAG: choice-of-anchor L domain-containing protein, partial [Deltaproteobacteria bacterium]|nr:choice-of-anchor L domain-containing protein [Deltaproteobacteria bacterium]